MEDVIIEGRYIPTIVYEVVELGTQHLVTSVCLYYKRDLAEEALTHLVGLYSNDSFKVVRSCINTIYIGL